MNESINVSVVIPCLNEEKTVAICVRKALKSLHKLGQKGEVVVADNGSVDNSIKMAQEAGAKVINVPVKGYGSALIEGILAAKGTYIIMADADDSYNFEELSPFLQKLKQGYDFVIGNRFKGKIEKGAMPFLHRCFGTPFLTLIMNLFFKTGIGDVNCGMRAMTKEAFQRMKLKAVGMEFATEMVIKASLAKLKIAEVPCNLYKDKRKRKPHLNTWQDGWRHLRFMLLFASSWLFFLPGIVLFAIGLGGMSTLILRDILASDAIPFITQKHMLSFMIVFLFGSQIISLGLAFKFFNYSEYFDYGDKAINFLVKHFNLERGIVSGGALSSAGASGLLYLLISYLGALPYLSNLIRFDIAVFAMAIFMLGVQIIYTSFLLSLFYLKVK